MSWLYWTNKFADQRQHRLRIIFKMADFEVALTTEKSGENFCISVWDLSSGMQLKAYKGGSCSPHGLSVIGSDYIMAAQQNKSILHLWNIAKVCSYTCAHLFKCNYSVIAWKFDTFIKIS